MLQSIFHDQTPATGHFEPLISYRNQQKNGHMTRLVFQNLDVDSCKNKESKISSLQTILCEQSLQIIPQPNADCHESLFESICKFENFFDTCSVRKEIAQTFCNCLLGNDSRAFKTLETSIVRNIASGEICLPSWQAYVIQLEEPYCIGHIEGDQFCIQWLSEMLNSNIYLWNTSSKNIVVKFFPSTKSSKELYMLQHPVTNFTFTFQTID